MNTATRTDRPAPEPTVHALTHPDARSGVCTHVAPFPRESDMSPEPGEDTPLR